MHPVAFCLISVYKPTEIDDSSTLLKGGAVAQSVERATPGEEVPGSIPAVADGSLLGWVGVSKM